MGEKKNIYIFVCFIFLKISSGFSHFFFFWGGGCVWGAFGGLFKCICFV